MNVPLLDLKPQLEPLRREIIDSVTQVIDSTGYILGPAVQKFEEEVAAYTGSRHGVGVSSGTDALLASLMSLDIGAGDYVLTTPYTFFATMGTILRTGALPLFADVEPGTLNLDPIQAEEVLEQALKRGQRVKAILPVHLYGQCADMERLLALARRYELPVIEDAAQAIGAEYPFEVDGRVDWRKAGSMGIAGCFSFFPSKNLGGIGDGGMITSSDDDYADILRYNRNHGAEPKYYHARIGGNFRLDAIQAAVLSVKLRHLESWHAARRANAATYRLLFKEAGLVGQPVELPSAAFSQVAGADEHNYHIYNQFVIHVPRRDQLREHLITHGVGCEIYYPLCLHQQECVSSLEEVSRQSFPVAEQAAASSLALPIYPELNPEQLAYVVETIAGFFR
ncbi:DegT/DnrJ/EryC1/StrS family aminotransferase [Desulfogranum mediterraneum]|uniref:DegT/DnrJ/EryC1/StrS family aminotransferase n=1 Tax=Desulfogranum mediterraneum TaxID=160661 RepID=UPI0003FE4B37|nr:DegT/DnrJ/EryC1/StrS family aminotransferase [Desulfogranum mediterraneum]